MTIDRQLQHEVDEKLKREPQVTSSLSVDAVENDIEAALKRTVGAKAHDIKVAIDGAEVTLMGKVQRWADLEVATRSAWGTPGVHSVINKMTLAR